MKTNTNIVPQLDQPDNGAIVYRKSHLEIDRSQALRQLELLGYKDGDRIFLRKFPPKGVKGTPKNIECTYPNIPTLQASDGGLYFVVNGGGQTDKEVQQGRAIFSEDDNRPIEDQVLLWQEKGLPEPTAQVKTRKSVHTYYAIVDGCTNEQWEELQQDFLELMDGDRTIKNRSRVMRLAGAFHIKSGEEPMQCELIHEGPSYSYAELRAAIPHRAQKPKKPVGQLVELKPKAFTEVGSTDLVEILNREILPRLQPTQIYNWPGHNWEEDRSGNKLRGYCFGHDSQSGTAFHIEPNGANGEWLWHCPSCKIGGGAVEYRDRLRGGNGSPKGKEWVAIVQELAREAGVTLPEQPKTNKPKTGKRKTQNNGDSSGPAAGGDLVPLAANYKRLEALLGDRLKWNSLTKDIELDGEPVKLEDLEVHLALKHNVDFKCFFQIAPALAKENTYSPVVNYLNEVSAKYGSDTSILEGLAERYFGRSEPIFQTFIRKWLVSAVARALEPGCKVDTALILQGRQGANKSSFFKTLAGEWFDDSVGDVGDKDERLKLHRVWIAEWSELETVFRRKDVSAVKAFLTTCVDHVRPPYGRSVEAMKRMGVIVGTTNDDDFLRDPTGNRRFWIIPVAGLIDLDILRTERDRIWAAAVALYRAGEQWWLTRIEETQAELINEQFKARDPWEDVITLWLKDNPGVVTTSEILSHCLKIELGRQGRGEQMRVAEILKSQGFENRLRLHYGRRQRVWVEPERHNRHNLPTEVVPQVVPPESQATQGLEDERHNLNNLNEQKTKKATTHTGVFDSGSEQSSDRAKTETEVLPQKVVSGCASAQNPDAARDAVVTTPHQEVVTGCDSECEVVPLHPGMRVEKRSEPLWFGRIVSVNCTKALVQWVGYEEEFLEPIADLKPLDGGDE